MDSSVTHGNDASSISNRLLKPNGGSPSVVWCDVHIDPRDIDTRAVIDGHGTEKRGEVADPVGGHRQEYYISTNAKYVGKEYKLQETISQDSIAISAIQLTGDRSLSRSDAMAAAMKAIAPKMYTGTVR